MNTTRRLEAWLNPLEMVDADPNLANIERSPEAVLDFLCVPGASSEVANVVQRFRDITPTERRLFAVPNEPSILNKLIWPLRGAKGSHMLGNFLGTVALCGMVGEMVAILLFELEGLNDPIRALSKKQQEGIFGSTFEKLGQYRRVQILSARGTITDELKEDFELLRRKRNRYLHYWSQDHERLEADSKESFDAALSLVHHIIGQEFSDGKIALNPALVSYLEREGVYIPEDN